MTVYGLYGVLAAAAAGLIALGVHHPAWRRALCLAGLVLGGGTLVFLWSTSQPGWLLSDFKKAYYPAGRLVWEDPVRMYRDVGLTFVNLPIVAIGFSPFAALGRRVAALLYTGLGGFSILASTAGLLALSRATGWRKAAVAALVLFNGPLYNSAREGQTTHFILLTLIGALLCLEQGRQRRAGALLALGALIKPPLGLLVGPFLWRRRWMVAWGWTLTLTAAVGLSLGLFGLPAHQTWWRFCIEPYARYPLGAFNVQSLDGFLARLLISAEHLMSWFPVTEAGPAFFLTKACLLGVLLIGTALILRRACSLATAADVFLETAIVLVLALLISPISWSHYYLLLLIPMALVIGGRISMPAGTRWAALFWVSVVLVSLPVRLVPRGNSLLHQGMGRLFISHYFIGGVLLLGVLLAARQAQSQSGMEADHP